MSIDDNINDNSKELQEVRTKQEEIGDKIFDYLCDTVEGINTKNLKKGPQYPTNIVVKRVLDDSFHYFVFVGAPDEHSNEMAAPGVKGHAIMVVDVNPDKKKFFVDYIKKSSEYSKHMFPACRWHMHKRLSKYTLS